MRLKLFASVSMSFAFLNNSTVIYVIDFSFYSMLIRCFFLSILFFHTLLIGLNRFSSVATNFNYIIWILTENHRENDLFITKPILDMDSILMTLESFNQASTNRHQINSMFRVHLPKSQCHFSFFTLSILFNSL